jgi:hypothetical protein
MLILRLMLGSNTRGFAATKWTTTAKALNLVSSECVRALHEVATHESYGSFITECMANATPSMQSRLQTLQLVARPISVFIHTFETLVAPEEVQMSLIWGLLYLNVKVIQLPTSHATADY